MLSTDPVWIVLFTWNILCKYLNQLLFFFLIKDHFMSRTLRTEVFYTYHRTFIQEELAWWLR